MNTKICHTRADLCFLFSSLITKHQFSWKKVYWTQNINWERKSSKLKGLIRLMFQSTLKIYLHNKGKWSSLIILLEKEYLACQGGGGGKLMTCILVLRENLTPPPLHCGSQSSINCIIAVAVDLPTRNPYCWLVSRLFRSK